MKISEFKTIQALAAHLLAEKIKAEEAHLQAWEAKVKAWEMVISKKLFTDYELPGNMVLNGDGEIKIERRYNSSSLHVSRLGWMITFSLPSVAPIGQSFKVEYIEMSFEIEFSDSSDPSSAYLSFNPEEVADRLARKFAGLPDMDDRHLPF